MYRECWNDSYIILSEYDPQDDEITFLIGTFAIEMNPLKVKVGLTDWIDAFCLSKSTSDGKLQIVDKDGFGVILSFDGNVATMYARFGVRELRLWSTSRIAFCQWVLSQLYDRLGLQRPLIETRIRRSRYYRESAFKADYLWGGFSPMPFIILNIGDGMGFLWPSMTTTGLRVSFMTPDNVVGYFDWEDIIEPHHTRIPRKSEGGYRKYDMTVETLRTKCIYKSVEKETVEDRAPAIHFQVANEHPSFLKYLIRCHPSYQSFQVSESGRYS